MNLRANLDTAINSLSANHAYLKTLCTPVAASLTSWNWTVLS